MRVLLTNHRLCQRSGSELFLRDLALALAERDHQPIAYAPSLGEVAEELRAAAVPVVGRLDRLGEPPDLIHGQHNQPTMAALLACPGVPAVFFCHGWLPWEEMPPRFPRILRYVAVDRLRRERLVSEEGIAPDVVEVIPNFVDLRRFRPRAESLPERPRRALLLSNHAVRGAGFAAVVSEACAAEGVELEVAGASCGHPLPSPETRLAEFHLVFARGRSAMEAMAVGAAVILCDVEGLGPMVTEAKAPGLATLNFGIGALRQRHEVARARTAIRRYDAVEARAVQAWIRSRAGLDGAMDRILEVYRRVLGQWATSRRPSPRTEAAAAALYLERLADVYARQAADLAGADRGLLACQADLQRARDEIAQVAKQHERLSGEECRRRQELERELAGLAARAADSERELGILTASRAVLARRWLLEHEPLARLYRLLRGAGRAAP